MPQVLFPGSRSQPREHVCFSAANHWIVKDAMAMCKNQDALEPPDTPVKPEMLVYILIVSKNTIYNRQCYLAGLVIFSAVLT